MFEGTINRVPVVTEKAIFSSIKIGSDVYPIVLFRMFRSPRLQEILTNKSVSDQIKIEGRLEVNPKTEIQQIVIDQIYEDQSQPNVNPPWGVDGYEHASWCDGGCKTRGAEGCNNRKEFADIPLPERF